MRTWMIPWLFPLAILLLVVGFLINPWAGVAAAAIVLTAAMRAWRAYLRDGGKLPQWSGWRITR